jgi:hypothetical protein
VGLEDEQINLLNERVGEFQAADYRAREEIVLEFLGSFKNGRPRGVKFDKTAVSTVRAHHPLATLSFVYVFFFSSLSASTSMGKLNKEERDLPSKPRIGCMKEGARCYSLLEDCN